MIVSIHQPAYLPWLGYLDKILRSDLFIYLDTVQFQKGSFQNRNHVRGVAGPILLTVPVLIGGRLFETTLKDVRINNLTRWRRKHAETIRQNYQRAPMFARHWPLISAYYEREWEHLADLCFSMLKGLCAQLGINTKIMRASELAPTLKRKSDLVLELCQQVGATEYLAGKYGRAYLNLDAFSDAGIAVRFQEYRHPRYTQQRLPFQPNLAALDLLFNEPGAEHIVRAASTEAAVG